VTAGPAPDSRRPNVIGGPGCDFIAARIERVGQAGCSVPARHPSPYPAAHPRYNRA
jgi:hypothetical protein